MPEHSEQFPVELSKRIEQEAAENDNIYRRRSLNNLDLSRLHYGHVEMLTWALHQIPRLEGSRVLDIGVGEGQSSVLLAQSGAHVTGTDVSGAALERATELAARCGVKIDFRQMPGEHLCFEDDSFDAIFCISAYHHMDLGRAASEFARVLKPGGRLVMIEPLATNPAAWLYRRIGRFLSREATSKETPLHIGDLKFLRQHFRRVISEGMFFWSIGLFGLDRIWNNSNPLVHRLTKAAFKWVSPFDSAVLKVPGLQRIAWKIRIVADR